MSQHQNKVANPQQNIGQRLKRQALNRLVAAQEGFTLVEMAISLMIIGLIIGAILYSAELVRIVEVRRVMADINSISAATKGFQEKYGSVPGDFPLATTRIPNCTAASFCTNGNGDGFVGQIYNGDSGWDQDQSSTYGGTQSYETTQFFKHLAWGHFITEIDPRADPTKPGWNYTNPGAATGGGFTVFADTMSAGSSITIRIQMKPTYGGAQAIDGGNQRPYTVKQAIYMDQKYDDGRAAAGNMWGIPYAGAGAAPPCRKSWSGSNGENYNMDPADSAGDSQVCQFHFIFH